MILIIVIIIYNNNNKINKEKNTPTNTNITS